jgi:TonB family protein
MIPLKLNLMYKTVIFSFALFVGMNSCIKEKSGDNKTGNQREIDQDKSDKMSEKMLSLYKDSVAIVDSNPFFHEPVKKNDSVIIEEEVEEEPEEIFIVVEDMPRFGNGDWKDFRRYVSHQLNYPSIALENGISGEVLVQFTVDETGNVKDVFILRGVDPCLDREAFRVVCLSPKWIPGKQRGRPVSTKMIIPVKFVLQ